MRVFTGQYAGMGKGRTYCCYEDAKGQRVQIVGQWECCYMGSDDYGWKKWCEETLRDASNSCFEESKCKQNQ